MTSTVVKTYPRTHDHLVLLANPDGSFSLVLRQDRNVLPDDGEQFGYPSSRRLLHGLLMSEGVWEYYKAGLYWDCPVAARHSLAYCEEQLAVALLLEAACH